jgi:hypothetical protein
MFSYLKSAADYWEASTTNSSHTVGPTSLIKNGRIFYFNLLKKSAVTEKCQKNDFVLMEIFSCLAL